METIKLNDSGPAVEDVQNRLRIIGLLADDQVTGTFDEATAIAVRAFTAHAQLPETEVVDDKVWAALVDASYSLGDRTLYLRMPYFHGHDVLELQQALGALGFGSGINDAIFGAHTELALRKFQMNLGLPSDGIAGAYTYAALRNLHHSWAGKEAHHGPATLGFARAASVLESNALCLFGTDDFTRSVASRMSNLALATNPASHVVSADALSVAPDASMLLVQVGVQGFPHVAHTPVVTYDDEQTLALRLSQAIDTVRKGKAKASGRKAENAAKPLRIVIELPKEQWEDAGVARSAQHFAITLLDALCAALS